MTVMGLKLFYQTAILEEGKSSFRKSVETQSAIMVTQNGSSRKKINSIINIRNVILLFCKKIETIPAHDFTGYMTIYYYCPCSSQWLFWSSTNS